MICVQLFVFNCDSYGCTPSPARNSQTTCLRVHVPSQKNDPLCMAYHPYHFVGEVLLHPVYRVFHEECHSFREFICHVMLMKKVHMNNGLIFNNFGQNDIWHKKWYETLWSALSWPILLESIEQSAYAGYVMAWHVTCIQSSICLSCRHIVNMPTCSTSMVFVTGIRIMLSPNIEDDFQLAEPHLVECLYARFSQW